MRNDPTAVERVADRAQAERSRATAERPSKRLAREYADLAKFAKKELRDELTKLIWETPSWESLKNRKWPAWIRPIPTREEWAKSVRWSLMLIGAFHALSKIEEIGYAEAARLVDGYFAWGNGEGEIPCPR